MDVGCLVQNVGTAASIYDALAFNRPLIERVVTVTGKGVNKPVNVRVRLGDTVGRLIEQAGGYTEKAAKLILGGPMMGIAQFTDDVMVIKGTSCILVMEEDQIDIKEQLPCISCTRCVGVCPMNLIPTTIAQLVEFGKLDEAKNYGILDCIECGCCSYICPAKRNLLEYIKFGKALLARKREQEIARKKAAEEKSETAKTS